GKVSSANERFVTRAKVQLTTDDGVAASTASDESGLFDFVDTRGRGFLSEGVYDLTVGKPGYGDTLITGVSLAGGAVKTLDVSLKRCEGTIEGRITDGTNPVVEATVEARPENTQDRFTRITDENGVFRLDRIPAGRYLVGASRSGYTFLRDTAVTTPVSGLNMILVRNRGRFWGRVLDWETGMGVAAGLVANDGCGNESRTLAAADGSYDMQLLPTLHSYTFTVYASGYATVARENVSAERGDTTLFRLRRIYGSVEGRVTLKPGGAGVPNIPVRTTAGSTVFIDTTDGNGLYRSIRLPVNQYYVTLEKAGHLPSPAFRSVGLWNGENKTGLDFELEKVELASLAISGPASVASGGKAAYSYSAKTSDGRSMPITAQWSVDLPAAVDSMNAAGVLALKSDFLGPITVRLRDIHSGIEDSATVHAVADLLPNDGERIFQDYRGALFFLPSGCVAQSVSFGVKYPAVPDAKRLSPGYEALGRVLAFHPDGMVLAKSMELVLPLPEAAGESAVLGRWNPIRLRWETVQGEAVRMDDVAEGAVRKEDNVLKDNVPNPDSLGLRAESQTLTQWTILEPSQSLGLREFEAKPNPFSPFLESLKLSFVPTSNASSMVFVTAVFYNMNGEPVRNLVVGGMFPKGRRAEIIWDGRTDSGALAMNGRYLVSIEAKDGTGVEKKLLTVVLVK
ncbi:MAG TPA: carboxypeptidase regulatory-like domain-containing protein, partial [bacterium]